MIHALYHAPAETLGLIKTCLDKRGLNVAEHHLYAGGQVPSFSRAIKALIVMGGPMNVDETRLYSFLDTEVELIKQATLAGRPVLGICLGAQLIAKALGARVYPNSVREVGWRPIELLPPARKDILFRKLHRHSMFFTGMATPLIFPQAPYTWQNHIIVFTRPFAGGL